MCYFDVLCKLFMSYVMTQNFKNTNLYFEFDLRNVICCTYFYRTGFDVSTASLGNGDVTAVCTVHFVISSTAVPSIILYVMLFK